MHMEKKNILIAVKDGGLVSSLESLMDERGYRFLVTQNGFEAWELFQEYRPALVIADLSLDGLSGLELLERIYVNVPEIPVILVGEHCTTKDILTALERGAFEFIEKPVRNINIVQYIVKKALEYSSLIRKNLEYIDDLERLVEKKTLELQEQNRKLEEEIKERKKAEFLTEHAKREWKSTIDALPDMIALLDRNYSIIRMNRSMAQTIKLSPDEAVGRKCYREIHGTDRPPDYCPHKRLLKDGKSHSVEIFDEGLGGYHEINVVPYFDADGTIIGSVHVIRNINTRKKIELEKERIQTQLLQKHKLESVGQLAAGIAHEINTPAQYVGSNIDFLHDAFQDTARLVEQLQKFLSSVEDGKITPEIINETIEAFENADWDYLLEEIPQAIEQSRDGIMRITSIVRAMKDFSHPGSSEKEPCDLNQIIETTTTIARNEWKYVAEMELELDQSLPPVPCLADEMGQVFLNLIVNAAHAIGEKLGDNPDSGKGIISIKTVQEHDFVVVTVSDTGAGIPEEVREKIFEPFFTTKEVGRGTGQGLAIARNVMVEKHGGDIDFETVPGQGTTFIIKLPV